ncbi:MAG: hypothetical protein AB9834_00035 [Lentimicrobium sp.]
MKALPLKYLVIILAVLITPAFTCLAQTGTKTKSIKKEFVVGQDVKLNIETSFGKVHCNVWDKNLMTIDVLVTADARSDKDAMDMLNQITPVITGNSSLVEITTKIGKAGNNNKSKSFSIDYTINMPRSTSITVQNRFGDLYIDETTSPANITIEYGNMTINRLTNPASAITLKFSNGTINTMGNTKLDLEYSTLKVKNASDINSETKFTTLDLEELNSLVIDSEYDNYNIGEIKTLTGSGKFSTLDIDKLIQKLELNVEYGGLDVNMVDPAFTLINLVASFNGIDLGIPSTASYLLNADLSFGDCRYPKESSVTVTEKSYTSKLFTGKVGPSKSPTSKVNIKGKNCDVKLY